MAMTTQTESIETREDGIDSPTSPLSIAAIGNLVNAGVEVDAVTKRVIELAMLRDGWLDGEGKAPDPDGLAWLNLNLHVRHLDHGLPQPHLYPSQDGSIGCEWSIGHYECEIEVDLKRRVGNWPVVDVTGNMPTEERELDLQSTASWQWLDDRIQSLAAA